jgi:protein associated with RNAse G/E
MDINRILYDMQVKIPFYVAKRQGALEIDEYILDQAKHRNDSKLHYSEKVDSIISDKLTKLVATISESRTISD